MGDGVQVVVSQDAGEAWAATEWYLAGEPVVHNVVLTLLAPAGAGTGPAGRRDGEWYAWAVDPGRDGVVGVAVRVPAGLPANVTAMPAPVAHALAEALADVVPDLPGVRGEAAAAAAFAGAWAERRGVPVVPVQGERLYALADREGAAAPGVVSGHVRAATAEDVDVVARFVDGFAADTGAQDPQGDPATAAAALVAGGRALLWDDGDGPVAMAFSRAPVAGVGRVGRVYTLPERRGRGLGAAVTVAATQALLDEGAVATLLTQLDNPTSNALYRRLGYRPVHERLHYRFG